MAAQSTCIGYFIVINAVAYRRDNPWLPPTRAPSVCGIGGVVAA